MSWLKLLPMELNSIEKGDFIEPSYEVRPDDHLVGNATVEQIKLYTLANKLRIRAIEIKAEVEIKMDFLSFEEFSAKYAETMEKYEALIKIFWVSVKDEFGLWDKDSIGIRKGFVVVWDDSKPKLPPFLDMLRGLGF